MSESNDGFTGREVAYRLFAAEYRDADHSYSESDEDRAPNYVVTPTGARVNRLFVVGVLTEVEQVGDDILRARVVDPTGAFVLYAGQYQPDEQAFLEGADTPSFVAVTGKARTFQPEDSEQVFTSIRPESITTVDAETRDRWTVQAAEQTIDRVETMAAAIASDHEGEALRDALEGVAVDPALAHGITLALDHYGTTPPYLDAIRDLSLDALRVVTGEKDEVERHDAAPSADGAVTAADLAAPDLDLDAVTVEPSEPSSAATPTGEAEPPATDASSESTGEADTSASSDSTASTATDTPSDASTAESADASTASTAEEPAEPATEPSDEPVVETEATTDDVSEEPAQPAPEQTGEDDTAAPTASTEDPADEDIGDFDPESFDIPEEERQEVEEEFGTEFQSGTEVPEPGEADMPSEDEQPDDDEPAPDATAEEPEPAESEADADAEPAPAEAGDGSTAEDDEADGDADPQEAVIDVMKDLDEGEGVDRETLIDEVASRYGLDEAAIEDGIQDALMDGQCYEPDDTTLQPI